MEGIQILHKACINKAESGQTLNGCENSDGLRLWESYTGCHRDLLQSIYILFTFTRVHEDVNKPEALVKSHLW